MQYVDKQEIIFLIYYSSLDWLGKMEEDAMSWTFY